MKCKFVISLSLFIAINCGQSNSGKERLKKIYENHNVVGSFILYDLKRKTFIRVNPERTKEGFLPASTFKIVNSIIALEEKIVPDENYTIKWDGIKREYPQWNRDHDLKSAFRNSVVWYYQILARKIGKARMKKYLSRLQYGNGNLSSSISTFWLQGGFRVTQEEQIDLLLRLYNEKLPVSNRTMRIVRRIMISEMHPDYTIHSKTGMTYQGRKTIGWWVGYIKKRDNAYFFANNIEKINPYTVFPKTRIKTAKEILRKLNILHWNRVSDG